MAGTRMYQVRRGPLRVGDGGDPEAMARLNRWHLPATASPRAYGVDRMGL